MSVPTITTKVDLTRKRIVLAASKLFAQKGFRAMTLRDVTKEAKVNLAAVNYHFGSKSKLMEAIIETHFTPINLTRSQRLHHLNAQYGSHPIPLEAILTALIEPLFLQVARETKQSLLTQIIGRAFTEPSDFVRQIHKNFFNEICTQFMTELKRTCPHLPETELHYRFFFAVSTMLGSLVEQTRLETLSKQNISDKNSCALCQGLIQFVVAGFQQNNPQTT